MDLANWALRTSPKFTTEVKYQFHQGFSPDQRSENPFASTHARTHGRTHARTHARSRSHTFIQSYMRVRVCMYEIRSTFLFPFNN